MIKSIPVQTFQQWMRRVDRKVERRVGLSASDLADICYRDLYDAGGSPASAARRAIRASGGEF